MKKVKIAIGTENEAFKLVEDLMPLPGNFALFSGDCKECVDAKSFLGVLYFMIVHPNDTYLYSSMDNIPEQYLNDQAN